MNEENKLKWSRSWHKYFCTLLGRENDMIDKCKACNGTGKKPVNIRVAQRDVVDTGWVFRGFPILLGRRRTDGCEAYGWDIDHFKKKCLILSGE